MSIKSPNVIKVNKIIVSQSAVFFLVSDAVGSGDSHYKSASQPASLSWTGPQALTVYWRYNKLNTGSNGPDDRVG